MIKISITKQKKKAATFTTASFQLSIMSAMKEDRKSCRVKKFETCVDNKANLKL